MGLADLALWADGQADQIQEIRNWLKTVGPLPALRKHIFESTGKKFDRLVGRLVTAACNAMGKEENSVMVAARLKKRRQRSKAVSTK